MRIVADENIPDVSQLFSHLGEVERYPGRQLSRQHCADADILLVRSITPVNAALLEGSRVKFVGTATIGTDHLDTGYLDARGVRWASAPGSNADSVVEYVLSAFCRLDGAMQQLVHGASVGIIGMGNVGARLYRRLRELGIRCVGYDPLISPEQYPDLCSLGSVLQADFVCLHAPLTRSGPFPSFHLLGEERLAELATGTTLVSAGRGAVVDNDALLALLHRRHDISVVQDVWEGEPNINLELMKRVDLATPHIAGYSYDGKRAGARMIYRSCCEALGVSPIALQPDTDDEKIPLQISGRGTTVDTIREAVLSVYDIALDDQRLRGAMLHERTASVADSFDQLRKHYPVRREFHCHRIVNAPELTPASRQWLSALGFQLSG